MCKVAVNKQLFKKVDDNSNVLGAITCFHPSLGMLLFVLERWLDNFQIILSHAISDNRYQFVVVIDLYFNQSNSLLISSRYQSSYFNQSDSRLIQNRYGYQSSNFNQSNSL
jgi:hypothetical protein